MRCKKHPGDQSCRVGVCASCLRERLLAVIAAQEQAQALKQALHDCRKSDAHLSFPRSVSPYISRRKSDTAAATCRSHASHHLFYSTPQVGPNASIAVGNNSSKKSRFSFWGIFRSKKEKKPADPVSHPTLSVHSCSASPAWFPSIISGRQKKKVSMFSVDESVNRDSRNRWRGLSPERGADHEYEHGHGGSSGHSSECQSWRQTPRRTPASTRRGGGRTAVHSKSLSGLTFCLSPLVRPSPNRHWNQKVAPPETAVTGEVRATPKPRLSTAASFCKNRSRKLVDLGRYPTY